MMSRDDETLATGLAVYFGQAAKSLAGCGHPIAAQLGAELETVICDGARAAFTPAPALDHLPTVGSTEDAHALARLALSLADKLPWREVHPSHIPDFFVGRHAYCELVGPDGVVVADGFRSGLYVQAPDTFYPSHAHDAEEIYFVLSGMALWQTGGGEFEPRAPGTLIHHPPGTSHATQTTDAPLFAMWGWQGDLSFASYRVYHPQL